MEIGKPTTPARTSTRAAARNGKRRKLSGIRPLSERRKETYSADFRTIKPVDYTLIEIFRAPHIHVAISRNGRRIFTTQLLVAGHPAAAGPPEEEAPAEPHGPPLGNRPMLRLPGKSGRMLSRRAVLFRGPTRLQPPICFWTLSMSHFERMRRPTTPAATTAAGKSTMPRMIPVLTATSQLRAATPMVPAPQRRMRVRLALSSFSFCSSLRPGGRRGGGPGGELQHRRDGDHRGHRDRRDDADRRARDPAHEAAEARLPGHGSRLDLTSGFLLDSPCSPIPR